MIVTLTANPSHDRTVALAGALERGEVQRVSRATVEPGGKGVNVARAATNGGVAATAVFPAPPADPFVTALTDAGIDHVAVPIAEPVRTNLTLSEPDGTTTKVNEHGPALSDSEVDALVSQVVALGHAAAWLVLAGSLPPGAPADLYARIATALRDHRVQVAVDTSGEPLRATVAGPVPVDLVKPNAEELADLVGGDPARYEADPTAAARAASKLVEDGIATVLLTLGAAGTVAVRRCRPTGSSATSAVTRATFAPPLSVEPRSTVGAGDSSLTGWVLADLAGHDADTSLRWATAWGAAAVSLPGTALPTPDLVRPDDVEVQELDVDTA